MVPRASRIVAVVVAAALVAAARAPAAAAPRAPANRAWAAAAAHLPAATEVLVGVDLAQVARTSTFKLLLPVALGRAPALKQGLATIKATCGFDPLAAIQGVVVGADAAQARGALFVEVKGLDEAALARCMEAVVNAESASAAQVTVTRGADGVTELAVGGDRLVLRWVGPGVLALPLDLDDRAQLATWTGGKRALPKARAGKLARRVDTGAAVWAVSTQGREIEGQALAGGYGALTVAGGALTPDLHLVLPSEEAAAAMATKATAELATRAGAKDLAAPLRAVLGTVTVVAAGAEVVVRARVEEAQLLALVGALVRS